MTILKWKEVLLTHTDKAPDPNCV